MMNTQNKNVLLAMVLTLNTALVACSADKAETPVAEPALAQSAEPTQGQVISEQLHKPLDDAKNVEKILQQEVKDLDKQMEEQSQTTETPVTP